MAILFGNIVNYVFVVIGAIIIIGVIARFSYNKLSTERLEEAVIIDKQCYDKRIYRKSSASFAKKYYVITFKCKNKRRHFYVSELSYTNYKVGQKGTLKYKGSHLVDFNKK